MNKIELYSNVVEGRLQQNISKLIKYQLPGFNGSRVHIVIDKVKSKRSVQQNRLLWLYYGILSKELGYHSDEIHEIVKYKFLKREKFDEKTGECFDYIGSTAKLNKTEFGELVDRLIQWSAETFSIVLPLPNTQIDIDLE